MRITEVNTVISTDFAGGMFNSCHDVEMPSNNQKALGVLCGDYAVSYHSDQKAFRGRKNKGRNNTLNIFRTQQ